MNNEEQIKKFTEIINKFLKDFNNESHTYPSTMLARMLVDSLYSKKIDPLLEWSKRNNRNFGSHSIPQEIDLKELREEIIGVLLKVCPSICPYPKKRCPDCEADSIISLIKGQIPKLSPSSESIREKVAKWLFEHQQRQTKLKWEEIHREDYFQSWFNEADSLLSSILPLIKAEMEKEFAENVRMIGQNNPYPTFTGSDFTPQNTAYNRACTDIIASLQSVKSPEK